MRTIIVAIVLFLPTLAYAAQWDIPTARVPTNASHQSQPWYGYAGTTNTIPSAGTETNCVTGSYSGKITFHADGTTDDRAAIVACIAAVTNGNVAYLPAGDYAVSDTITMTSGKTLRGAGMGVTTLVATSGFNNQYVGIIDFQGASGSHYGSSINISSGYTKGSQSITLASSPGWSVGDVIVINQLNNPTGDPPVDPVGASGTCSEGDKCGIGTGLRMLTETNKVTSVNGAIIGLENPLMWEFSSGLTPQATRLEKQVINAGLESLTIDMAASGSASAGLSLYDASNCWVYRVEVANSHKINTKLTFTYRNTIRESYFGPYGGSLPIVPNTGYGLLVQGTSGANLVENNIFDDLGTGMMLGGGSAGNVTAYNYFHGLADGNRQSGAFRPHDGHPHMNLFEGNQVVGQVVLDNDWGSQSHWTLFRNNISLTKPLATYYNAAWDVQTWYHIQYNSYVGNVMGTLGDLESTYECVNSSCGFSQSAVYKTGYTSEGDTDASGNDAAVFTTMLRHRNYYYAPSGAAGIKDCNASGEPGCQGTTASDVTLSNSLYLLSKPAWFGSLTYPPTDPVGPVVADIPAKYYYDNGSWPTDSPINGVCGTNKGSSFSSLTSGDANNCSSGTVASFLSGQSPHNWTWSCAGSGGGTNDTSCYADLTVTGSKTCKGCTTLKGVSP